MKKYMVYVKPEKGEPFRFVVGLRRTWLLWKSFVIFSHLPLAARVEDYKQLEELKRRAEKETGRDVIVEDADAFEAEHEQNQFFAVMKKTESATEDTEWYTGRRYRKPGGRTAGHSGRENTAYETSKDIYDCQMFVRKGYAIEALQRLNQAGETGVMERLYVNVTNIFFLPGVVTICVNKKTGRARYLKSYKEGDHRLRYCERLEEAMLLYPEETEKVYEYLSTRHKDISFTMVMKPGEDIVASELRKHEKELVQKVACDFRLRRMDSGYGKKDAMAGDGQRA